MTRKENIQQICQRPIEEVLHQVEIEDVLSYYIEVRKNVTVKVNMITPGDPFAPMKIASAVQAFSYACFWLNNNHFV